MGYGMLWILGIWGVLSLVNAAIRVRWVPQRVSESRQRAQRKDGERREGARVVLKREGSVTFYFLLLPRDG